jgi:hypothetical protein
MAADIESLLWEVEDPRLIRGIYNYCHRRCERCPFTDRCLGFRETRRYEQRHPDASVFDRLNDSFRQTFQLLKAWCEREGIDFDGVREEADAPPWREDRSVEDVIESNPLYRMAMTYSQGAYVVVHSLERGGTGRAWPPDVRSAIDTIGWYACFIAGKIHRAIYGFGEHGAHGFEDPVQNDWNGSAKAAHLGIAESRKAWLTVLEAGEAPPDSPLRKMIELLDRIDSDTAGRFPRAMEFVRPGFDEPDVAAGALTTLDCFDPRPG